MISVANATERGGGSRTALAHKGATVTGDQTIDIPTFINIRKIGGFQLLVVALCAITVFLDGFDVQSIAFVAPSIAAQWHVSREVLGPIFVASLVGVLCGALGFGPLADKIGRRPVIMGCTAVFGLLTLITALSSNVTELIVLRFLAGLGLGGAMPNAIALTAEYSPQRRRATMIMIMFAGFSLGAAIGGALAAALIPHFGWRSVWYLGGALPLLLLPAQYHYLPESLRFLVISNSPDERISALVQRIDPGFQIKPGTRFDIGELRAAGVPVRYLFDAGRGAGTILLWIMFFMNLLDLFFLQNWIPIISNDAGVPVPTAVMIASVFQFGGVVATLLVGFPFDRIGGYAVLPLLYVLGGLFVVSLGQAETSVPLLFLLTFGAGFCVVGAQTSANAHAAIFYPTPIRSTGVGWCLGIGRLGAILGPLIAGYLLGLHWTRPSLFLVLALPLACAAVAVLTMGRIYRGRGAAD